MWGALIAAGIALAGQLISQNRQEKANKGIANRQQFFNKQMLEEQLEYNTPANQMRRFQDAGLNPHLIYGQGSPGNQAAPLTAAEVKPTDYQTLMNIVPLFNQSRLADSQVQAQNAATMQKYALTQVNRLQARVLEKNPLLDDAGFKATIDGLKAAASLKEQQTSGQKISNFISDTASGHAVNKVFQEVKLLEQRFNLGQQDAAIKAEILKSKEFQNAILEVQQKFMTDGEIQPGHIIQFLQQLLLKIK